MKALVYGAGRMGRVAGWDLQRNGFFVDYADLQKADDVICIKSHSLKDMVELFSKYDVVLGCADYSLNFGLSKMCIEAKTHFCDLGGNNTVVFQQLGLHDEAKQAGVFIVPDCGLAPGMANLLAAKCIEDLGGEADEVNIRVGGLPLNPIPPLNYMITWSVHGLINEYLESCEVVRDGKIVIVDPLTENETLEICDQEYEAFHTSGGLSTLGSTYQGKVKNMDYKTIRYPGHCAVFAGMKSLGLFEGEAREMLEKQIDKHIVKGDTDKVYVRVQARRGQKQIRFDIADYYDDKEKHSSMSRMTGFSLSAVAEMLCSGMVSSESTGGALPGERLLLLHKYIECMRKRGINILRESSAWQQ